MPAAPAALTGWPRVHDAERKDWPLWFRAQGIDDTGSLRGPAFDETGLLLQAVLAGQGAGLLPAAMVAADLADGRLDPRRRAGRGDQREASPAIGSARSDGLLVPARVL
jgi:DNA-binding transcriptional LysR family regulator